MLYSIIRNVVGMHMENSLQGKSAFVVGGTSGIGYSIAQALLHESVSVVVQGKHYSQQADLFCSQGNVAVLVCDLADRKYEQELCLYAQTADILCVAYGPFLQKSLDTTTADEWSATVYANLALPGMLVSAALPGMMERQWGRVLLFGGTETQIVRGFKTNPAYGAAKTGLMSLVRSVSMGYAAHKITANAICPGFTDNGLLSQAERKVLAKKNPDGLLVAPTAITDAALFLLRNSTYNGIVMPIDKGWSSFSL